MSMYPIASTTLSSTAVNVTFTGIPQNFTHLQIRIHGRSTGTGGPNNSIQFNGDTAANYRVHYLGGNGSGTFSGDFGVSQTFGNMGWVSGADNVANGYGIIICDILDYSNTNKNKTLRSITGFDTNTTGSPLLGIFSSVWTGTNAINQILIGVSSGAYTAGTRFDIYGISNSNLTGA